MASDGGSDGWVDVADLDVLSIPESESDEAEHDSRVASAVIEALEEAPAPTLQGISLGSLPQFLGGWYSSSPPAAGRTFSLDLESPAAAAGTSNAQQPHASSSTDSAAPSGSAGPSRAAPVAAAAPEDNMAAQRSTASPAPLQEPCAAAAAAAAADDDDVDNTKAPEAPAAELGPDTTATGRQHWGHAALLCLLSAVTLAALLLLLCAAAGICSHAHTGSSAASSHLYTTAAAGIYRSHGSKQTRLHGSSAAPAAPAVVASSPAGFTGAHQPRVLRPAAVAHAHAAAVAKAAAARAAARAAAAKAAACACARSSRAPQQDQLPWWLLAFNTSSSGSNAAAAAAAGTAATHGSGLPSRALHPSSQLVASGSPHANMTASECLRLQLWLLLSTARDGSTNPAAVSKLFQGCLRRLSPYINTTWPLTVTRASPQHTQHTRHTPRGPQCTLAGITLGWLSAFKQPAGFRPAHNPAGHAASQGLGILGHSSSLNPFHSLTSAWSTRGQGLGNNSSSKAQPDSWAAASTTNSNSNPSYRSFNASDTGLFDCAGYYLWNAAALFFNLTRTAAPAAATPFLGHHPTTTMTTTGAAPAAAPAAASQQSTAAATAAAAVVPPTKPVPPLYRPPLPCLLLGGGLRLLNNMTPASHSTARHSVAGACGRSSSSSNCTWLNVTTRHQQGPGRRVWPSLRGPKPYASAWAIYMAKWGLQLQQQHTGRLAAVPALPMLLPSKHTVAPAANGTSSSSSHSRSSGSNAATRRSHTGVTLPMLPPTGRQTTHTALAAAQQQQQQQQQSGHSRSLKTPMTSSSGSSSSSSGAATPLTLPMLPPVSCAAAAVCSRAAAEQQAGGVTLPMLPPVPCIACSNPQQHSTKEPAAQLKGKNPRTHMHGGGSRPSPCPWALSIPSHPMVLLQQQQQLVQMPLRSPASLHKPTTFSSSTNGSGGSSAQTCRAAGSTSTSTGSSFILVHQLAPITAAAASAAAARSMHGQQYSSTAAQDPVESILLQLDPFRQYSSTAGCDATAVPLRYLSGGSAAATAAGLPGPAAAAALCIKNSSWAAAVAAASKLAAAAEGLKGFLAPVLSSIPLPGLVSAAAAAYRNASGNVCLPPGLLPQSLQAATGSNAIAATAAAAAAAGSNGSSEEGSSAGSSKQQGASTAGGWVASLVTLPMLPPSRHEGAAAAAADVALSTNSQSAGGAAAGDTDAPAATATDAWGCGARWYDHALSSRNITPKSRNSVHSERHRQPLWLAPSI